jgi:hypothetical protein
MQPRKFTIHFISKDSFLPCNGRMFHNLACEKHSQVSAENWMELMEMFHEFSD